MRLRTTCRVADQASGMAYGTHRRGSLSFSFNRKSRIQLQVTLFDQEGECDLVERHERTRSIKESEPRPKSHRNGLSDFGLAETAEYLDLAEVKNEIAVSRIASPQRWRSLFCCWYVREPIDGRDLSQAANRREVGTNKLGIRSGLESRYVKWSAFRRNSHFLR